MPKADKAAGRRVVASKLEECIDATNECLGRQKANENDIQANKQLVETIAERVSTKADREELDSKVKGVSGFCDERWESQGESNIKLSKRILAFESLTFFGRLRWILTGRTA